MLAERIRARVEALAIPLTSDRARGVLTISVGVAGAARAQEVPAEALVAAADRALYRAKERGRNRVERGTLEGVESAAVEPKT